LLAQIDPAYFQAEFDQAAARQAANAGSLVQAKAQLAVSVANAGEPRAEVGVAGQCDKRDA
jgi:multidrug resistance efflux pump